MYQHMKPSDIRFCQDSVCFLFEKQSAHSGVNLGASLDQLANGAIDVSDIPPIRVVKRNNLWFTSDNRRLWVFRNLESLGKCNSIPVIIKDWMPDHKMTTDCDGVDVLVRGRITGRWHHKSSTIVVPVKKSKPKVANSKPNYGSAPTVPKPASQNTATRVMSEIHVDVSTPGYHSDKNTPVIRAPNRIVGSNSSSLYRSGIDNYDRGITQFTGAAHHSVPETRYAQGTQIYAADVGRRDGRRVNKTSDDVQPRRACCCTIM